MGRRERSGDLSVAFGPVPVNSSFSLSPCGHGVADIFHTRRHRDVAKDETDTSLAVSFCPPRSHRPAACARSGLKRGKESGQGNASRAQLWQCPARWRHTCYLGHPHRAHYHQKETCLGLPRRDRKSELVVHREWWAFEQGLDHVVHDRLMVRVRTVSVREAISVPEEMNWTSTVAPAFSGLMRGIQTDAAVVLYVQGSSHVERCLVSKIDT